MKTNDNRAVLILAASLCLAGFLAVMAVVVTGHAAGLDDPVRYFFYSLRGEGMTMALTILTNAADKYFIIALCLALLIVPYTRKDFGLPLSAGALGMIILNTIIKHAVGRARPGDVLHLVEEHGFSFPSGHSITSMFFYGLALWLVWHYAGRPGYYTKKTASILTVLLLIPLIIVGLSRIYLGVHFPTDVLGGWLLGAMCVFLEIFILLALEKRR